MEENSKEVEKAKQSTSKKPQSKSDKTQKKPNKKAKGQKDIRTLIKSKKNELLTYSKDFDLICKQSGIDVDPEQLQLAIALSKSLEDTKPDDDDVTRTEKSLTSNQRRSKIRTTLQEYGFQTKKAPIKKVKRHRKHNKLILVSDVEKQHKIADKYAEILINNICISNTIEESLYKEEDINSYLYNLSTNASYECIKNDDIFYCTDLVPKALHKKHIFKDWSEIPGRPVSPKLEKLDKNFKGIECSLEELDILLSGSIERAHDIIKNYTNKSIKFETTNDTTFTEVNINQQNSLEITSNECFGKISCDNKTIKDNFLIKTTDVVSYDTTHNMSLSINRCHSPDLFDDEATIIMDTSKDKISVQEGDSKKTVMVKEHNDFMELTNCIGIMNDNYSDSKQIACLSQGSNKTKSNSTDFMDLTECVPAYPQNISNILQSSSSHKKAKEYCQVIRKKNCIELIDLSQPSNFLNNIKPCCGSNETSLDDTVIIIDEDHNIINSGKKCNTANRTLKVNSIVDLVENQSNSSGILNTTPNDSDSTALENNIDNNNFDNTVNNPEDSISSYRIMSDPINRNDKENNEFTKRNARLNTVDLPQSSNFEDCLSFVKVHSPNSIVTYEIHCESDILSTSIVSSQNYDHNKMQNEIDGGKDDERSESFEAMDLTQSSNSEDCLQEAVNGANNNNECLYNTNAVDNSINLVSTELEKNDEIEDCVNLYSGSLEQNKHSYNVITNCEKTQNYKTNAINRTVVMLDNDCEFDNLMGNVSNGKKSNCKSSEYYSNGDNTFNFLDNSIISIELNNQELDLTENYDCSNDKIIGPKNLTDKSEYIKTVAYNVSHIINDDSCNIQIKDGNDKIIKKLKRGDDKSYNSEIAVTDVLGVNNFDTNRDFDNVHIGDSENEQYSINTPELYCETGKSSNIQVENIFNTVEDDDVAQDCDIDLTQQFDYSGDALGSPKNIGVPNELGKRNNISIDYDEVYGKENIRNYESTSFVINKFVGNDKNSPKEEVVSSSSQHSEVFELSDNEFNYSINQQKHDNESLTLKQAKFDIGGISVIDEYLNRNSLPRRSKLRCSCSLTAEPNIHDNELDSCLPLETYQNHENLFSSNVNKESCEAVKFVEISTPVKSRNENNLLIAKTPKHNDYIIKTDQVTPMPDYENMTSPERNNELDKYGVKPLKKKRAIQILTHIYNQTHPLMEVISDEYSSPSKIRRMNNVESFPRRVISSQMDSLKEKPTEEISNHVLEILEPTLTQKSSQSRKLSRNSQKSPEKRHIYREYTKSSSKENIMYEETILIPDIRNIECSPDDWVFQKREKAKVHSCRVPLHIAFHNYVSSRKALREAILRYEPINIDDIHKGLVAIGYRYNPKDLLKFMDKKCITVKTADSSRNNKNT